MSDGVVLQIEFADEENPVVPMQCARTAGV
jgi:hypothetical protein